MKVMVFWITSAAAPGTSLKFEAVAFGMQWSINCCTKLFANYALLSNLLSIIPFQDVMECTGAELHLIDELLVKY